MNKHTTIQVSKAFVKEIKRYCVEAEVTISQATEMAWRHYITSSVTGSECHGR